jgi:hypothetical protein
MVLANQSNLAIFKCEFFFIKGCSELYNINFDEFSLVSLPTNVFLRFRQGVSNDYKIDITHCSIDQFCLNVDYPIANVIETFKELAQCHPIT